MKLKNGQDDAKLLEEVSNVLRDPEDKPDAEAEKVLAEQRNKSDFKVEESPRIDNLIEEFEKLLLTINNKDVDKERDRRNKAEQMKNRVQVQL